MKKFEPRSGFIVQAYKYALDPTPTQARNLARHCGAARVAYNWAVTKVRANWSQRRVEETYGIGEDQRTAWVNWSLPALRKAWNLAKPEVAPWWAECSKEAYNTGLAQATMALKNYVESKDGARSGRRVGKPRRKRKGKITPSCRFTTGTIRIEADRRHVALPRIGRIKTHESTRKLARRMDNDTARVLSATVRFEGGRWFCSLQCEVRRGDPIAARPDTPIGVDVGTSHLAVLSQPVAGVSDEDGFVVNPRHLAGAQTRLRRASRRVSRRQGPDRRTGQKPSKRWEKANRDRNKVHHRVANLRRDGLHKLNAARNLAALVAAETGTGVAGNLEPHGSNGRGADRRTPLGGAGGCETSTPHQQLTGQDGDRPLVTADRK